MIEAAKKKRKVIQDGEVLRVPLMLMDHDVQEFIASTVPFVDSFGRPAGHRPGFVYAVDGASTEIREAARQDYIAHTRDSWRDPSATPPVINPQHDARAAYIERTANAWKAK